MEVTCPGCAARYAADDQKFRGKARVRMRCRACFTVWLVENQTAGATSEASSQNAQAAQASRSPSERGRAAVIKRGAAREHRDLFAPGPPDLGSVKQTMGPPRAGGFPQTLGHVQGSHVAARNESSVLFTVDALRRAPQSQSPRSEPVPSLAPASTMIEDDDGIIDLNALAAAPRSAQPKSAVPALFPSETPAAAFAADISTPALEVGTNGLRFGKRAFIGIGAAAVAFVLFSVGLAAAFRGEEPVARTANAMMAPTAIAPTATPTAATPAPTTAATTTAATTAAAANDDDAKSDDAERHPKKGKGRKGKGGARGAFVSTKVQSSGVAPVSKPAAKPADACGCKGNFDCIIRCAAKGK